MLIWKISNANDSLERAGTAMRQVPLSSPVLSRSHFNRIDFPTWSWLSPRRSTTPAASPADARGLLWATAVLVVCLGGGHRALAQGGVSTEGPLTLLRTDTTNSLLTFELPLAIPTTNDQPVLHFDFGFSTAELEAAQTFYDSFSVTLQKDDQSAAALLLTADRAGTVWAPAMPGGVQLTPADLSPAAINFPPLAPDHLLKLAFSIAFAIPAALSDGPATLFFDLFDNLNAFASLAWVANVRLEALVAPPYRLLSAPVAGGPYAEESGAQLDVANRRFILSRPESNRFYRVSGEHDLVITGLEVTNGQVEISFALVRLRLLSANAADGLYAEAAPLSMDEVSHTISTQKPASPRFYRLEGNARTRITGLQTTPTGILLKYALVP
jgi:hypothetical protein